MSKPAFYRCPVHGRIPMPTGGRAADTRPCPDCGQPMARAPFERENLRFVAIPATTYARIKAHAGSVGLSMGAVVDALTQDLGGEP